MEITANVYIRNKKVMGNHDSCALKVARVGHDPTTSGL